MKKRFSEGKLKRKLIMIRDKYAVEIQEKKYTQAVSFHEINKYRAEKIRFINEILQWIKESHD